MNTYNNKHQLYNARWTCLCTRPSVDKEDRYSNALSALYKEYRKVYYTHEDMFLPEGPIGKRMALHAIEVRINYYRQSRGWSVWNSQQIKGSAL